MRVVSVQMRDFRSYARAEAALGEGLTVVHGPNGAGKSNLLEALYFGCTGRSSRTRNERELVRFGADCYAYGLLASGFIDLVVEASLKPYDFSAMLPIVEGAGGVASDWRGAALSIGSDGRVRLTDFGVARPSDAEPLTRTGLVVGTARFVPPEVMRGRRPDERAAPAAGRAGVDIRPVGKQEAQDLNVTGARGEGDGRRPTGTHARVARRDRDRGKRRGADGLGLGRVVVALRLCGDQRRPCLRVLVIERRARRGTRRDALHVLTRYRTLGTAARADAGERDTEVLRQLAFRH